MSAPIGQAETGRESPPSASGGEGGERPGEAGGGAGDDTPPPVAVHPPLLFGTAVLAGLVLERVIPLGGAWPAWLRLAGGGVMVAGGALALWAAWLFHRAGTGIPTWRPAQRLVVTGPYALSRNPMYLGLTAVCAGLALADANPWLLALLLPVLAALDRLVIAREEPYLEARFGDAYRAYRARVRRWV